MPNWISITIDTLKEASVAALIEACDTAALGTDQDPRAAGIIQKIVDNVRRIIGKNNQVDEDVTTIPKGLQTPVVDIIIGALKKAISQELTEDERQSVKEAWRQIYRVADGDDFIDTPDTPVEPELESGPTPAITPKCLKFDRCDQDGV